jgi:hypothetical protein
MSKFGLLLARRDSGPASLVLRAGGEARRALFLNRSSELLDVERSLLLRTGGRHAAGTGATGGVCGAHAVALSLLPARSTGLELPARLSDSLLALRLSVGSGEARRALFLDRSSELLDVERSLLLRTRADTGATGGVCGVHKRSDDERVLKAIPFARRSTQQ